MAVDFAKIVVEPALHRSAIAVGREAERGGSGRPPPDAIGVHGNLAGIEMTTPLAFGKPQMVHEDARTVSDSDWRACTWGPAGMARTIRCTELGALPL